jgi:ribosome-binding protein aMBF1 (putative translation factor)
MSLMALHRDKQGQSEGRSLIGRSSSSSPNPVDVHVGSRLRLRRQLLGLSQQRLAEALKLTFQQLQKYERGTNRVSASRLWDLSGILSCPVSYFFEEMDEETSRSGESDPKP